MVSEDEVKKIARLANLAVNEQRISSMTQELNSIIDYVKQLEAVPVENVEPMSHVHGFKNVYREDQVNPGLETQAALQNAPDRSGNFIRVPIIIDQGADN